MTLKQYREKEGLTQKKLAYMLDVSIQTVNYWENGKRKMGRRSIRDLKSYGYDADREGGYANV